MHLQWLSSQMVATYIAFFEQIGLAYAPRPLLGTEPSQAAREKQKVEVSKKPAMKRAKTRLSRATPSKMVPPKRISIVKVARPRVKPGPQDTSKMELALAKLVGISKFFCLLDVPAPSHGKHDEGHTMTHVNECTACVVAFNNLSDDSSSDVRKTPLPKRTGEKCHAPPPSTSS
jgi:hypothetical protein